MELVSAHRRLDTATYEGENLRLGTIPLFLYVVGRSRSDCNILSTKEWAIIVRMTALYNDCPLYGSSKIRVREKSLQESVFKKLCLTDLF